MPKRGPNELCIPPGELREFSGTLKFSSYFNSRLPLGNHKLSFWYSCYLDDTSTDVFEMEDVSRVWQGTIKSNIITIKVE